VHAERALARASASSPVVVRRRVAKKTLRDARDKKCNFVVGRHARLARGDADDQGPGARRRWHVATANAHAAVVPSQARPASASRRSRAGASPPSPPPSSSSRASVASSISRVARASSSSRARESSLRPPVAIVVVPRVARVARVASARAARFVVDARAARVDARASPPTRDAARARIRRRAMPRDDDAARAAPRAKRSRPRAGAGATPEIENINFRKLLSHAPVVD